VKAKKGQISALFMLLFMFLMVLLIAFEVNILTADHELHMQYEFRAQTLTYQRNTQITLVTQNPGADVKVQNNSPFPVTITAILTVDDYGNVKIYTNSHKLPATIYPGQTVNLGGFPQACEIIVVTSTGASQILNMC